MQAPKGMVRQVARAMGTEIAVVLPEGQSQAADRALRLFAEWEECLSRFRPQSALSHLNRSAGRPVRVHPLLFEVLGMALAAAEATGGLYDPTVLRAIEGAGYDRSFERLAPDRTATRGGGPRPFWGGWRAVRMMPAHGAVYLPPGVGVDLGGIAKGMAVDAAIEALRADGIRSALVEAGGDLRVLGTPPDARDWVIAVPTPHRTYRIPLACGALATSGVAKRHWRKGGREAHHLIDPRTGAPALTATWAVTVGAPTCGEAEAAAKAAFLLDDGARPAWLAARQLPALVQRSEGEPVPLGAWPRTMEVVA